MVLLPLPAAAEWQIKPFVGVTFGGSTSLVDLENGAKVLKRQPQALFDFIDAGRAGSEASFAVDALQNKVGVNRRFRAALSFIAEKEECLVLPQRATESRPKLIEP